MAGEWEPKVPGDPGEAGHTPGAAGEGRPRPGSVRLVSALGLGRGLISTAECVLPIQRRTLPEHTASLRKTPRYLLAGPGASQVLGGQFVVGLLRVLSGMVERPRVCLQAPAPPVSHPAGCLTRPWSLLLLLILSLAICFLLLVTTLVQGESRKGLHPLVLGSGGPCPFTPSLCFGGWVLGLKLRALHTAGRPSTTRLHPGC